MARRTQSCARVDLVLFMVVFVVCPVTSCPSFQLVFRSVSLFPRPHPEFCLILHSFMFSRSLLFGDMSHS